MPPPRVSRRVVLASVAVLLVVGAAGAVASEAWLQPDRSDRADRAARDDSYVVVRMEEPGPPSGAGWQYLDLGPDDRGWIPESVLGTSRRPPGADETDHGWRYPLRAEPLGDAPITGYYRVS